MNFHIQKFQRIIDNNVTKGSVLYRGVPMAEMSPQRRGIVIEQIARATETVPTTNPKKTTRSRSSYDWMRGGARVECKSAQLSWNRGWLVHFKNIKQNQHDKLVLCLYLPKGIIVFECFDKPPLYGQGGVQEEKGKCLLLRAGKMTSEDAIKSITEKLLKFAKRTASITF